MNHAATASAFTLTGPGLSPVAGAISWSGTTLRFTPSSPFASSATYTARVGTGATDLAGNQLSAARAWSFATSAAPATMPVTASPAETVVQSGTFAGGSATDLAADDGAFFEVASTSSFGTKTVAWYGSFTGVSNGLSNLTITYAGSNSRACTQTVAVWRWSDNTWVQLHSGTVGTEALIADLAPPGGALGDYVSGTSGEGELQVRIRCQSPGSFSSSGDLLRIAYDKPTG